MIKCPNCGEEIETSKRTLFEKIHAWLELITFLSALGVLGIMLYNSFQMKSSIELTKASIELTKESLEVQRSQEEVSRKESIERNRPRIEMKPPEVILSDSGLLISTIIKNTGFSDAEDVRLFGECMFPIKGRYVVVSFSGDIAETTKIDPENFGHNPDILPTLPKEHVEFDERPGKITRNFETVIKYFVPKRYSGDFYSTMNITYSWSMYKEKYEDSKIYYHTYHYKDSTFSTWLLDVRMAPLMK